MKEKKNLTKSKKLWKNGRVMSIIRGCTGNKQNKKKHFSTRTKAAAALDKTYTRGVSNKHEKSKKFIKL